MSSPTACAAPGCASADRPTRRATSSAIPRAPLLAHLSRAFKSRAATRGIRVNPAFAGAYLYQPEADFAALFPGFLDALPDGGVVMCHPGHVDAELVARDPLTSHREAEFAFLASDGLAAALAAAGVELQ